MFKTAIERIEKAWADSTPYEASQAYKHCRNILREEQASTWKDAREEPEIAEGDKQTLYYSAETERYIVVKQAPGLVKYNSSYHHYMPLPEPPEGT